MSYLEAGIPVHLTGPTGTGKSTLAMHLAYKLNQPVVLMFGDEEFGTSDLVGDKMGYREKKLIDNFIHSVLKTEEESGYIKVHPRFRAIFTSNPHEYAGAHKAQDALLDRMVSIHLDYFDEETEQAIVVARSGTAPEDAAKIVGILRALRQTSDLHQTLSIRSGIIIARILAQKGMRAEKENPLFVDVCIDALVSGRHNSVDREKMTRKVIDLMFQSL